MVTPGNPHAEIATNPDQKTVAGVAYGLYALGLFGFLLPSIVAVIINYIKVDDSLPLYASHHRWMIRTFWWGLLWCVVGAALLMALVGFLILGAVAIWWIYRLVRGFLALSENKPPVVSL